MGIADTRRELPANRMIFEVRRDPDKFTAFADDLEAVMEHYRLSEAEREAFRHLDSRVSGTWVSIRTSCLRFRDCFTFLQLGDILRATNLTDLTVP